MNLGCEINFSLKTPHRSYLDVERFILDVSEAVSPSENPRLVRWYWSRWYTAAALRAGTNKLLIYHRVPVCRALINYKSTAVHRARELINAIGIEYTKGSFIRHARMSIIGRKDLMKFLEGCTVPVGFAVIDPIASL